MKKNWVVYFTCAGLLISSNSLMAKETTSSLSERVSLKKISDYWEERDEKMVKTAIIDFIEHYPQSAYKDELYAMLADLYFSEKNYPSAIEAYAQVKKKEYQRKTHFRYLHSLYEAGHYEEFLQSADHFLRDPQAKREEVETIRLELAETLFTQAIESTQEGEKRALFKQALTYYQNLQGTRLERKTLEPLSQIYTQIEDYSKAAHTYMRRADADPARQEDFLFQAASLQLLYDKKSALHTFDQIFSLKGHLSKKAAYNILSLLFQTHRYADLIAASVYIGESLPEDKKEVVQYYLGKALFYESDFEAASEVLEELFDKSDSQLKNQALSALLLCAQKQGDLGVCDRLIQKIAPDNPQLESALLLHTRLCRHNKEWSIAREDLMTLLSLYPNHPEAQAFSYDIALFLLEEGKNTEAMEAFSEFIQDHPHSSHKQDALRNLLHLRLGHVSHSEGDLKQTHQNALIAELKMALDDPTDFSIEEQKQMQLLLGRHLTEQKEYTAASQVLNSYLSSSNAPSYEAYLLLAMCCDKEDNLPYINYLEKALELNSSLDQESKWHRTLFNRYLKLCETSAPEEKERWLEAAATHLLEVSDGSISQDNQRWLVHYYLDKNKDAKKAICALERLIQPSVEIRVISLSLEADIMHLCTLYKEEKEFEKGRALLEELVSKQAKHPDWEWRYQRMAQFELGSFYALLGNHGKAIEIYQELIFSSSHLSSYFSLAAKLEMAKIKALHLNERDFQENSPQALALCDLLKEVQTSRHLSSEPLHIEASLAYIDLKTKLAEPESRPEKKSLLLEQVKQDLNTLANHEEITSDKKLLVEHYLSFVEIQLSLLKKELPIAKTKEELLDLLTHVYNQPLKERLEKSLEEINQPL